MVRSLTDEEAKRVQISENLQREDVHPIEEAEGFQALIDDHGQTADMIAEQCGKSRSYVYGRLKLLDACPEIRKACLAGEIGSEVALLIARLRTPKYQEKALGYIKADWHTKLDDGGKASYRAIRALLAEKFTLNLKDAIFDLEDEMLLPIAGHCIRCPKRTGNAPEYADMVERSAARHGIDPRGSADICTDPDCFDAKKKAHLKREADKLAASGAVVVSGNAARSAISAYGEIKGAFVALKDVKEQLASARLNAQKNSKIVPPQVVVIQDPRTGKTHKAVKREEIKAAGVKMAETKPKDDYEARQKRDAEQRRLAEEKARAATARHLAILERVRAAAAATERSAFDLQLIAQTTWSGVDHYGKQLMAELYGVKSSHELEKRIGQMAVFDLTQFLITCSLVDDVKVQSYNLSSVPKALFAAAKHYGIELSSGASTPNPAAQAGTKAPVAAGAKKTAKPKRGAIKVGDSDAPIEPELALGDQDDDAGVAGGRTKEAEAA
jgi:hypothetical protein